MCACGLAGAGRLVGVGFQHGRWIGTLLPRRPLAANAGRG
jgi:hypothetical protein